MVVVVVVVMMQLWWYKTLQQLFACKESCHTGCSESVCKCLDQEQEYEEMAVGQKINLIFSVENLFSMDVIAESVGISNV